MTKQSVITILLFLTVFINIHPLNINQNEPPNTYTLTTNIEPFSAKTEWRYFLINGKTYRRLYDITNQCWIGEWELCT